LFLACVAALVAITGDPQAGAPVVRVPLTRIGATKDAPAGWREALAPEPQGEASLTPDTFELSEHPALIGADDHATITLPAGGQMDGASTPVRQGLPIAPIAGLSAPGPGGGLLPVIAPDGRNAAQAYARPFTSTGAPRVALIVGGLGLNPQTTRAAIDTLPPEITLSFAPYAEDLQGWIDMARAAGHEVLLEAPMEPADYPSNDPGPYTLLAAGKPDETARKLDWLLSRATGYFGVTNYLGGRFLGSDTAMTGFSAALAHRGVAFIDDGQARRRGGGLMRASADSVIDDQLSGDAINRALAGLEAGAFKGGAALGSGFAYPVTLSAIKVWAQGLPQRGVQLAPASAVMSKR
jgi:polysaccharide deacetylase 2 family uncharacterized protein YibQ